MCYHLNRLVTLMERFMSECWQRPKRMKNSMSVPKLNSKDCKSIIQPDLLESAWSDLTLLDRFQDYIKPILERGRRLSKL